MVSSQVERLFVGSPFLHVTKVFLLPNGNIGMSKGRGGLCVCVVAMPFVGTEWDPYVFCLAPCFWKLLWNPVSCNFHPILLLNNSKCPSKAFHVLKVSVLRRSYSSAFGDLPPLTPSSPSFISRGCHQSKLPPWGCSFWGSNMYQGVSLSRWWLWVAEGEVALGAALLVSAAHFCGKGSLEMSICAGKGNAPNLRIAIRICRGSLHVCAGRQTNTS